MEKNRVVVVGANRLGCLFALSAQAAGLHVTLIDEHPQAIEGMSFDAPYFYGPHLPASLADEQAVIDNVLSSNELLMECIDAEIDVRVGTIAWGAFQNGPNATHVGEARVGLSSAEGGEYLPYDHLVVAGGSRDFVPSFRNWELAGVLGGKAALTLLESYRCYYGMKTLVLGSSELAIEFVRKARDQGIEIAGIVEPGDELRCDAATAATLADEGVPIFINRIIGEASGSQAVTGAVLISAETGEQAEALDCDTICVAIAALPNVELPAAMGCDMFFADKFGAWLPRLSHGMQTSVENVYWLSNFSQGEDQVVRALESIVGGGESGSASDLHNEDCGSADFGYVRKWIDCLDRFGDGDVVFCQCETVTRKEYLQFQAPNYLNPNRQSHLPIVEAGGQKLINQDQLKRLTRAGMGHCQGKRCRDEAAYLLNQRFGVDLKSIRPASYRIPVRPVEIAHVVADDEPGQKWVYWVGSAE